MMLLLTVAAIVDLGERENGLIWSRCCFDELGKVSRQGALLSDAKISRDPRSAQLGVSQQ